MYKAAVCDVICSLGSHISRWQNYMLFVSRFVWQQKYKFFAIYSYYFINTLKWLIFLKIKYQLLAIISRFCLP